VKQSLPGALGLALIASFGFGAEAPQAVISNGSIKMKVYLPDAKNGFYRGTRFDWSGVIADLEYAGHNYYPPWFARMDPKVRDFIYDGGDIIAGPCSAVTGVPEEFSTTDRKALGYDEAKPGGTFIKIGVGVLRKPDDAAYSAYRLYEIVDGGKWTVRKSSDSVEFVQEISDPGSGYGYLYRKTVALTKGKPQMVLDHSLKNTGKKPIQGTVYNHNFLHLDRQAPGPDFEITFPFQIQATQPPDKALAEIRGNQILFLKTLTGEERVTAAIGGFSTDAKDYDIRTENRKLGAGVRITADRPLSRIFLWTIRAPLSLEPFLEMNIGPGQEYTWRLTYDYYTPAKRP
jgi:hypothetical protein